MHSVIKAWEKSQRVAGKHGARQEGMVKPVDR